MSYSLDLRKRVVEWVEKGGSVSKASKIYQVSRGTIYRWLNREDLRPTVVKRRKRKLDWEVLRNDIEENPDAKLAERAKKFGVRPSAICYALKEMKISRKKNDQVSRKKQLRKNKIL
jgi:transposase